MRLLRPCASIARVTFVQGARGRLFHNLLLVGLLVVASSLVLTEIVVGDEVKVVKDLGLTCSLIFGLLIAVFVGSQILDTELSGGVAHTLLTKPVSRAQYVVGKFAGITLLVWANLAALCLVLVALLYVVAGSGQWSLFRAAYLISLELAVMSALTVCLSTFLRPQVAVFCLLSVFVAGHSTTEMRELVRGSSSVSRRLLADVAYFVLPNLDHFDVKAEVVHELPVDPARYAWVTLYGGAFVALLLLLGARILARREF